MPVYLITGESGTGKTSLAAELRRRGYRAYDGDTFAYHADPATGQPITARLDHYAHIDWLWDTAHLRQLLAVPGDLFITGATDNQQDFYPLFATIFIFTIDAHTLTQRLQHRRPGDYGMRPEELQDILHTFQGFTQRTIEAGAIPIDAAQPLAKVADDILAHIRQDS